MGSLPAEKAERLADVAAAHRDARATVEVHRRKLQDAVLEAIDTDHASPTEVARAIGVSPTRVYAIIEAGYRDR